MDRILLCGLYQQVSIQKHSRLQYRMTENPDHQHPALHPNPPPVKKCRIRFERHASSETTRPGSSLQRRPQSLVDMTDIVCHITTQFVISRTASIAPRCDRSPKNPARSPPNGQDDAAQAASVERLNPQSSHLPSPLRLPPELAHTQAIPSSLSQSRRRNSPRAPHAPLSKIKSVIKINYESMITGHGILQDSVYQR